MVQLMCPLEKPPLGLMRAHRLKQRLGGSWQMPGSMKKIEHCDRTMRKQGPVHPPKTSTAITEPDDTRGLLNLLLMSFELHARHELLNIAQARPQSTTQQLGDNGLSLGASGAQACQDRHFDFALLDFAFGCFSGGSKGHHHPISSNG